VLTAHITLVTTGGNTTTPHTTIHTTHTYAHTTHTYTHTYIHTTHTHTTHTYTLHTHIHTHAHTPHTHIHIHKHTHTTNIDTPHTHILTHTHTTHTYTYTTNINTQTTHTYTHKHIHTTHTNTTLIVDEVHLQLESALSTLLNITEKSGELPKSLKGIVDSVRILRSIFANLKNSAGEHIAQITQLEREVHKSKPGLHQSRFAILPARPQPSRGGTGQPPVTSAINQQPSSGGGKKIY